MTIQHSRTYTVKIRKSRQISGKKKNYTARKEENETKEEELQSLEK